MTRPSGSGGASFLADIAATVRAYRRQAREQAQLAREIQQLRASAAMLALGKPDRPRAAEAARSLAEARERRLSPEARRLLADWPRLRSACGEVEAGELAGEPGDRTDLFSAPAFRGELHTVAWPASDDQGDILTWLLLENLPGRFPYTAGASARERAEPDEGEPGHRVSIGDHLVADPIRQAQPGSPSASQTAAADADPIRTLAFSLARAFTSLEDSLASGLSVDEVAANLAFADSHGTDRADALLGRVARRIWAVAMRERYGANERSQQLEHRGHTDLRGRLAAMTAFNDLDGLTERVEERVLGVFDRIASNADLPRPVQPSEPPSHP